jgi:hypothetical protein
MKRQFVQIDDQVREILSFADTGCIAGQTSPADSGDDHRENENTSEAEGYFRADLHNRIRFDCFLTIIGR